MKTRTGIRFPASLLLGLCLLAASPLAARPRSLLNLEQWGLGGYGGPQFKPTTLNGRFALLDGGGTRLLLLQRSLCLGAGGYRSHPGAEIAGKVLGGGYGGLWLEYDPKPDALVHFSFGGLVAMGGAGYFISATGDFLSSGGVVLDPELYLHLNVTEIMRFSLGVGYRFFHLFDDLPDADARDFSGPTAIIQLRFLAL